MMPELSSEDFGPLESRLRQLRASGHKTLVPYVTGQMSDDWTDCLAAYVQAGADAIEVGLPFSDPTLDGATIQEASDRALMRGARVTGILDDLARSHPGVPLVAMTYYNLVVHHGPRTFCAMLRDSGISGLIVPDVPLDEVDDLEGSARETGIELVLLASPATPAERLREIGRRSRGFVYAVSLMGTTGERTELADSAPQLATAVKAVTDRPVLLGFGISGPRHAAEATRRADGVVMASALMRMYLDGASVAEIGTRVKAVRAVLDGAGQYISTQS